MHRRRCGSLGVVPSPRDPVAVATSAALAGAAGFHVLAGLRLPIPGVDPAVLSDAVAGMPDVPPPAACFAVAAALGVGAALVAGAPVRWPGLRTAGQAGVVLALGGRGLIGLIGRTDLVAPGRTTSPRFRAWDRRLFTPLCLALSAGAAHALVRDRRR
jgi:hypothetical protein